MIEDWLLRLVSCALVVLLGVLIFRNTRGDRTHVALGTLVAVLAVLVLVLTGIREARQAIDTEAYLLHLFVGQIFFGAVTATTIVGVWILHRKKRGKTHNKWISVVHGLLGRVTLSALILSILLGVISTFSH